MGFEEVSCSLGNDNKATRLAVFAIVTTSEANALNQLEFRCHDGAKTGLLCELGA